MEIDIFQYGLSWSKNLGINKILKGELQRKGGYCISTYNSNNTYNTLSAEQQKICVRCFSFDAANKNLCR